MIPGIAGWLKRLDRERQKTLVMLSGWTESELRAHPAEGGWSALEVLTHVARTESAIAKSVCRDVESLPDVAFKDHLKTAALSLLFMSPARVKAPAAAPGVSSAADSLDALKAIWTRADEHVHEAFRALPKAAAKKAVFVHPVSGAHTPAATLRFLVVHIIHHRHQLRRIGRSVRSVKL